MTDEYKTAESNALWVGDPDGEMRRHRNHNSDVRGFPRAQRRAEIVCAKAGNRLLAVVFPVSGSAEFLEVLDDDNDVSPLGVDLLMSCRCGADHAVDGGRLRSAVMESATPRGGRAPRIEITDISD